MFQNCDFSQVVVVWLFNRNVYKKTASYDTIPVDDTEEYVAEFLFFRANMTVLVCPENGFPCIDLSITFFITWLLSVMLIEIVFTFFNVTGRY